MVHKIADVIVIVIVTGIIIEFVILVVIAIMIEFVILIVIAIMIESVIWIHIMFTIMIAIRIQIVIVNKWHSNGEMDLVSLTSAVAQKSVTIQEVLYKS